MIALLVGDLVYDSGRDEMATVAEIVSSSEATQMVRLEPADGGPTWTAPSYDLQLQRSAA